MHKLFCKSSVPNLSHIGVEDTTVKSLRMRIEEGQ